MHCATHFRKTSDWDNPATNHKYGWWLRSCTTQDVESPLLEHNKHHIKHLSLVLCCQPWVGFPRISNHPSSESPSGWSWVLSPEMPYQRAMGFQWSGWVKHHQTSSLHHHREEHPPSAGWAIMQIRWSSIKFCQSSVWTMRCWWKTYLKKWTIYFSSI